MPANAFLTTVAIGNREDLIDMIYNVAPSETPFISSIDKVQATSVTHEWQRDTLRAGANNAVAEGADASYTAVVPTQRLTNQTQISRITYSISATQEKVSKAGRKSEIRYQAVKQGKELRKDMEVALIENPTYTTGATRVTKGLRGFIGTNSTNGGGAAVNPSFPNTGPTNGTDRTMDEAMLKACILATYISGGKPTMIMVPPYLKQRVSGFTGNGTKFIKGEAGKLEAAWDVYASDFGDMKIVPNRQMVRTREVYLLDPEQNALAVLRDMETEELAKIGSARNFMVETEYALECREERGLGVLRDLI